MVIHDGIAGDTRDMFSWKGCTAIVWGYTLFGDTCCTCGIHDGILHDHHHRYRWDRCMGGKGLHSAFVWHVYIYCATSPAGYLPFLAMGRVARHDGPCSRGDQCRKKQSNGLGFKGVGLWLYREDMGRKLICNAYVHLRLQYLHTLLFRCNTYINHHGLDKSSPQRTPSPSGSPVVKKAKRVFPSHPHGSQNITHLKPLQGLTLDHPPYEDDQKTSTTTAALDTLATAAISLIHGPNTHKVCQPISTSASPACSKSASLPSHVQSFSCQFLLVTSPP